MNPHRSWTVLLPLLLAAVLGGACTVTPVNASPKHKAPASDAAASTPAGDSSVKSPPKPVHQARLDCSKDGDCAFVSRPCTCSPCGEVWKEVLNRKELAKLESMWARQRCDRLICPTCVGSYLGTKAVCEKGQCAAR